MSDLHHTLLNTAEWVSWFTVPDSGIWWRWNSQFSGGLP